MIDEQFANIMARKTPQNATTKQHATRHAGNPPSHTKLLPEKNSYPQRGG
ncbi:hypothetical protein [Propionibacterium freudenreichii]|nr:hypothetical protein [Propionibacterium freudenreichii]MDK9662405.1 hypothetical protein [Propionibacterium freudenreichii]